MLSDILVLVESCLRPTGEALCSGAACFMFISHVVVVVIILMWFGGKEMKAGVVSRCCFHRALSLSNPRLKIYFTKRKTTIHLIFIFLRAQNWEAKGVFIVL